MPGLDSAWLGTASRSKKSAFARHGPLSYEVFLRLFRRRPAIDVAASGGERRLRAVFHVGAQ